MTYIIGLALFPWFRVAFAENRFPLFGAMLCCRIAVAENRFPLFGAMR